MSTSSRAMLWYFWRMSRRNILLLLVSSLGAALFIRLAQEGLPGSVFGYMNVVVQTLLITAFSGCLFMFGRDTSFLPNPALLTLPVSTTRYLRIFYGYVITVAVIVSFAATAVHIQILGDILQKDGPKVAVLQYWQLPLLCTALACLMQSLFHLTAIKNEFRVLPMAIVMEVLAFRCVLPIIDLGHDSSQQLGAVAVFAILFAWASSYNSLVTQRNGRQRGGITALLEWFDFGKGRTRPFSSSGGALFWLNWNRYGRLFPLWTLVLTLIGSTVMVCGFLIYTDFRARSLGFFLGSNFIIAWPLMACGAAFLTHIVVLMRSQEDLFRSGRGFFMTLPVRSDALARGRSLAILASFFLVLSMGAALVLAMLPQPTGLHLGREFMNIAPIYVIGLWLFLWFGVPLVISYLAAVPLMFGVTILGLHVSGAYAQVALAVGMSATVVFCLVRGIRLRLLSRVDLCLFTGACLPALVTAAICVMKLHVMGPRAIFLALFFFCALLPVALPFVGAPLLMNWIRHR